ncbi:inosine-uridine preferring nucleoside hydrolase [Rhizoctonia solani 123E]|uniref:Inosine-uridine preferring nucleoside hydrolase n=1 Tax=Rhizoctonia solani 123E TaxID=1423351 RepID=A0A074S7Z8_9AGAM|nr:inosine-uridine preferring nucleoside hydrolase [Rhizoctonia solani 123E]
MASEPSYPSTKYLWLDCDPGHDDAIAILLALYLPGVQLLGISTVHGNASQYNTFCNAIRLLYAYGASDSIQVYPGAPQPLLRPTRADPEIHGVDGLGGVIGLPDPKDTTIRSRYSKSSSVNAVQGLAQAVKKCTSEGNKLYLVATGPLTNVALFSAIHPELLSGIGEIIFMGGGVGVGNRSATAEFNILCDPEAAQMVLNLDLPKVMIPLNVTHTAILTSELHTRLIQPVGSELSTTVTPLRHMLSSLVGFFAESYRTTFGFTAGPPIHDACCLVYLHNPNWFKAKRYRVDVELTGLHTAGETVVDVWEYARTDNSWGAVGKNCIVTESMDVRLFFQLVFDCIEECDKVSPLNASNNV